METADNQLSRIESLVLILLFIGAGWLMYKHYNQPDKWYLNYIGIAGTVVNAGTYNTREECAAKLSEARRLGYNSPECGSNCKPPETPNGVYVCEETFML